MPRKSKFRPFFDPFSSNYLFCIMTQPVKCKKNLNNFELEKNTKKSNFEKITLHVLLFFPWCIGSNHGYQTVNTGISPSSLLSLFPLFLYKDFMVVSNWLCEHPWGVSSFHCPSCLLTYCTSSRPRQLNMQPITEYLLVWHTITQVTPNFHMKK